MLTGYSEGPPGDKYERSTNQVFNPTLTAVQLRVSHHGTRDDREVAAPFGAGGSLAGRVTSVRRERTIGAGALSAGEAARTAFYFWRRAVAERDSQAMVDTAVANPSFCRWCCVVISRPRAVAESAEREGRAGRGIDTISLPSKLLRSFVIRRFDRESVLPKMPHAYTDNRS